MPDTRIHSSLDQLFQRQRLIFWYDASGEWRRAFDTYDSSEIKKLVVDRNEFGTKVRILGDSDPLAKFLLYVPAKRPADNDNWLLDLVLQGHEFKADRASLVVQEVGLPYEFRPLAEVHVAFFKDSKRQEALKDLVSVDDGPDHIRLKMMAVLAKTPVEIEAVLLDFLKRAASGGMFDPVAELFGPHALAEPFWKEVAKSFGYHSSSPSVQDFVTRLFREADPFDTQVPLQPHSRVFLQRWKDSQSHNPCFRQWSARLEGDLNISSRLDAVGERADPGEADAFEIYDKFVIHRLCKSFGAGVQADTLRKQIQSRRQSFWYSVHEHGYQAIYHAVELRDLLASAELNVESIDAGLERYRATWWKIDRAYRLCCFHLRRYGQVNVMEQLDEWIGKSYVNNFLLPLADRWSDRVRELPSWTCAALLPQRAFYDEHVRPFLDRGQKVFVIISDALRYEAAADFAERMNSENRFTAEMGAMLGCLPSYTQLGMASLLPGKEYAIDTSNDGIPAIVNGQSTVGTENRDKVLKKYLDGKGVAIQAAQFLELNTKTEGRALMREHDVIYIYHNVIDKIGDSAVTEAKTVDAVEQAFEELMLIVKKVANVNGNNMLLTADHGFLFQQDDVHKGDATQLPAAGEWINRNRRFAIGRNILETPGVRIFSAAQLGLSGDWSCAFPHSLGRFPLQGSGKRYVHGGFSLQEVVLPVVHINKSRTDDTGRVGVELMRVPAKITTGQVSLSLFQEKPLAAKLLPRELRVGVFTKDGIALSEIKSFKLESKSEEARNRETNVLLALSRAADEHNNTTVEIRLEETLPGTNQSVIYKFHSIKLQKPFTNDFDEF
jgi:uncharacterized protein (TIGR02687 family)